MDLEDTNDGSVWTSALDMESLGTWEIFNTYSFDDEVYDGTTATVSVTWSGLHIGGSVTRVKKLRLDETAEDSSSGA